MAYEDLAAAVKRRREELNLNQGDLSARGGPSITKVGQIERAMDPPPAGATLRKLDAALGWGSNTASSILRTGQATSTAEGFGQPDGDSDMILVFPVDREAGLFAEVRVFSMEDRAVTRGDFSKALRSLAAYSSGLPSARSASEYDRAADEGDPEDPIGE